MFKVSNPSTEKKLTIATSSFCNNNCLFCCDRHYRNGDFVYPHLSLERFIKENKKINDIDSIVFTGGEPTLNKNLVSFIRLAKKLGYKNIGLQTNGRLLSYKNFCIELVESGINEVGISIHGSNERIHECLTRSAGGFKQTYQGLCNIASLKSKYGLKINTKFTVTRLNYKDVYSFIKIVLSFKKIDAIVFNTLIYRGNARKFLNRLFVSYENIAEEVKDAVCKLKKGRLNEGTSIQVAPIPICLMVGFENYVGRLQIPVGMQAQAPKPLPIGSVRIKSDKCILCKYYHMCSGIDSTYIETFGWPKFTPIK